MEHRSQGQNQAECLSKLVAQIKSASHSALPRPPSDAQIERINSLEMGWKECRLGEKKFASQLKKDRGMARASKKDDF